MKKRYELYYEMTQVLNNLERAKSFIQNANIKYTEKEIEEFDTIVKNSIVALGVLKMDISEYMLKNKKECDK